MLTPWGRVFKVKTDEEKAEAMRQTIAAVDVLEDGLKECSGGQGPFFGGDSVGYVDVALGGLLVWVRATEALFGSLGVNIKFLDAARTPLLAAWAERFASLDAAKVALPDYGRLIKYTMMRRSAAASVLAPNN